eukprot:CAMPEP_0195539202 /NCGR_PEP_ID=MMETSP0794_2-20130614/49933_1 /TAXON_ID=515487 /ORGANISM="Stephanopyxis turris, Strain CCMP 815" /LENGTH=338 /DNA_ID=CAMNT_0040673225 /DNA_START=230 /DNA_END=1246 /DNA_ORIENTATION=+
MSSSSNNNEQAPSSKNIGRVALLQFKVTSNKDENIATANEFLSRAKSQNAQLCVLPEIWNGPYATSAFSEYAETLPSIGDTLSDAAEDNSEEENNPSVRFLMSKAKELNMWIVGGSIPERVAADGGEEEKIYNTCLCINPRGTVVGKHRKVHLFDIDVPGKITFRESDTLSPGTTITTFDTATSSGSSSSSQDDSEELPFGRIGVGICYDIRFPELSSCMVSRGCNILIFPGAFNLTTGPAHWELLQRARAVDGQCFVLTASPARSDPPTTEGKYPHYSAWGHSTAISPWGDVIATCEEGEEVLIVDLDMDLVEEMREGIPTRMQKRGDLYELNDLEK